MDDGHENGNGEDWALVMRPLDPKSRSSRLSSKSKWTLALMTEVANREAHRVSGVSCSGWVRQSTRLSKQTAVAVTKQRQS